MSKYYFFIALLTILVGFLVYSGMQITGTPHQIRNRSFDTTRIQNLSDIKYRIDDYTTRNHQLPKNLAELQTKTSVQGMAPLILKDPQTQKPYEYKKVSEQQYELCATFFEDIPDPTGYPLKPSYNPYGQIFSHKKGYDCIQQQAPPGTIEIPITPTINKSNIKDVTTDAKSITFSNFPDGFFSEDLNEWGLINYSNAPVSVTITFNELRTLTAISTRFTHCPEQNCYTWSAKGVTEDGKNITLVENTMAQAEINSTVEVNNSHKLKQLIITAQRNSGGNANYMHWQKIMLQDK